MERLTDRPVEEQNYWKPLLKKRNLKLEDMRVYDSGSCITFNSYRKGPERVLSNLHGCKIQYEDKVFHSAEAIYFYLLTTQYPRIQEDILKFRDGRAVKNYMCGQPKDSDWEQKAYSAMRTALRAKAESCGPFRYYLINTGDIDLVEDAAWCDIKWGCKEKDNHYYGINATGRLLMELRESLRNQSK